MKSRQFTQAFQNALRVSDSRDGQGMFLSLQILNWKNIAVLHDFTRTSTRLFCE